MRRRNNQPPRLIPTTSLRAQQAGEYYDLHGAAQTRVIEARKPEAKAPTERVEGVGVDEAVTRIADWLAQRKLI